MFENMETITELSKRLRVPKSWVYARTREKGKEGIPTIRVGKYLRFIPEQVDAWLVGQNEKNEA